MRKTLKKRVFFLNFFHPWDEEQRGWEISRIRCFLGFLRSVTIHNKYFGRIYSGLFWNKKDIYWNQLNLVTSCLFHYENGYHICIIFQICFTTSAPSSGVKIDFAPHIKDETWNEDIYCSSFQGWIENLGKNLFFLCFSAVLVQFLVSNSCLFI